MDLIYKLKQKPTAPYKYDFTANSCFCIGDNIYLIDGSELFLYKNNKIKKVNSKWI